MIATQTVLEPPKDGRPVLVSGRIVFDDGIGTTAQPVLGRMKFDSELGEWRWYMSGLVVRQFAEAVLQIDAWRPMPHPADSPTRAWIWDPRCA